MLGAPVTLSHTATPAQMHCDPISTSAWWCDIKLPARLKAVRPVVGAIKQKNSAVLPYVLK